MSSFTDYTTASEDYDEGRTAVASDVILSLLRTHTGKDSKQGRRRRGAGGGTSPPPPLSKVGGGAQVGLCPPPPLLGRANVLKICYDKAGNLPNKGRNFNTQTWGKIVYFLFV